MHAYFFKAFKLTESRIKDFITYNKAVAQDCLILFALALRLQLVILSDANRNRKSVQCSHLKTTTTIKNSST